jgi:cytochrome P450
MQGQQPLITQYVDVLMDRLHDFTHDKNGNPFPAVVNLTAWFNFATFDIIGDLAFGEPFNCLAESRYHPWVDAILRTVEQFGWWLAMQWHVPQLLKVIRTLSPGRYIGAGSDTQVDFATQKVTKRLELGASRPDFLEAMMTAEGEDGAMLTRDEMVANSRILVLAGSETTSSALAGTAYFLAKYPKVQRRLAEEVRSGYGSEEEIDLFSVNKLKYMLAVLDESMRMFPPVPSQLPRVCHQGGDVICGVNVPENVSDLAGWY